MNEWLAAVVVVSISVAGLVVSNFLVDRGVDSYVARRVPAVAGGVAFLLMVLWMEPWNAVVLGGVFTGGLVVLRWRSERALRGVAGSVARQPWVEITFVAAGTVSLAIGWGFSGDRWLAFVPIGFMAWGDTASGIVSELLMRLEMRVRLWPSVAMFVVCLGVAAFYSPWWVAAVAGGVATYFERRPPMIFGVQDDNWAIVGSALAVMILLTAVV